MIRTVTVRALGQRITEDAVVFPIYRDSKRLSAGATRADRSLGGVAAAALASGSFKGARGETRVASSKRGRRLVHAVLVGLGTRARTNTEETADALGAAARELSALRVASAAVVVDEATAKDAAVSFDLFAHAIVKGMVLATHDSSLGALPEPTPRRLTLLSDLPAKSFSAPLRRARLIADLTARVRDWTNTPGNVMGPKELATALAGLCREYGAGCRVWKRREIERARMGAVLAVGSGSGGEPHFVAAQWNLEKKNLPLICLVGKGVTFDSGGISIKPWEKMHEMKGDMAGGAVVVATLAAAAALDLPVRLVALVPCVENMPDGRAFRPGDVLTTCSGKTIEVLNTDAEGRLILADAVAYARAQYKPDAIIDVATLTGGVVIALGTRVAGVLGTSEAHIEALRTAADRAGEPLWPLPYDEHYAAMTKGDISDYKNYAGRNASPITAGALVGAFAGDTPWVHIDIAGTAWNEGGGPAYQNRGATGYGVDLLLRYLEMVAEL